MAKVKIQGHASGTGVLTVTAPNTSTDRTITLPDSTGTLATTADVPAGITSSADATAITINSSEQVGIGKTPVNTLDINHSGGAVVKLWRDSSSGYLQFSTNGTDSSIMNGGGIIKFKTGSDTVRASVTDNGICFGTDTAAANALDDYEEGTWSPNVGGNASYTVQNGTYVKVGKMCTASCEMHINAIGNAGSYGTLNAVRGLPFNSIASPTHASSAAVGYLSGVSTNIIAMTFRVDNNSNIANSATMASAGTTFGTGENLWTNGSRVLFSLTYITA